MVRKQIKEPSKPGTARLNFIYIIYVLRQYTDELHPMSIAEITRQVNKEFVQISERNIFMSSDTVSRTLDTYVDGGNIPDEDPLDPFTPLGFRIECIREQGKKLYYYKNDFDDAEIRILIDSIKTCSYLATEDVVNIVQKLINLQPRTFEHYKHYREERMVRDDDSLLIQNVDYFNEIIRNRNCASITYCNYDLNRKLVPREGYPRVVRPVSMMWSNGFYYLLAYSEKYRNTVNYRMDRITEVEEIPVANADIQDEMNPAWYRLRHPVMYSGRMEHIRMLCRDTGRNYIMNVIMDYFGKLARVKTATDDTVLKYTGHTASAYRDEGITWLEVTVEASVEGVELWVSQYCEDCLIISPESSREKLLQKLQSGASLYRNIE